MAYRRSITAKVKLFYEHQHRVAPSFSHIHSDREESKCTTPDLRKVGTPNILQKRFLLNGNKFSSFYQSRDLLRDRRFVYPTASGQVFTRNYSAKSSGEEEYDWSAEFLDKGAEFAPPSVDNSAELVPVLVDKSVELAPVLGEVAAAAQDSFFPIAILQHVIDFVHCSTGLNWWAAIVLTTILIRTLQIPVMIHQLKATTQFTLLRPKLEAIKDEMNAKHMDPESVTKGQEAMKQLFKEYGVTPFTPMKGIFITGPVFCCFFLAIRNMAEKVPSFHDGGILWFTDLATPDSMYFFPVLTALTFWITVELNAQEGLEGNPTAGTIKNVSRVFAALTVPLTATFPKAIFCYWITSNLFSLTYGMVMKRPIMKKLLDIPIIPPPPPPSANQKPPMPFFQSLMKYAEAQQYAHEQQQKKHQSSPDSANEKPASSFFQSIQKFFEDKKHAYKEGLKSQSVQQMSLPPPAEVLSKPTNQKVSSSSFLSQRIKSLEEEVKQGKKGRKGKKRKA